MIGGTSEDDFSEAIALVRFEPKVKLKLMSQREGTAFWNTIFVSKVWSVVGGDMFQTRILQGEALVSCKPDFQDTGLQAAATLALGKFMCVSCMTTSLSIYDR